MNFAYMQRAAILCFGCFFLVHAVLGLTAYASAGMPIFDRINPRRAARLLFALRLMPCVAALLLTCGLVAPAYSHWESRAEAEPLGPLVIFAAVMGAVIWMQSLVRFIKALWEPASRTQRALETSEPFLAVAGIFRARIIVSRGFLETIPEDQRDVAQRHEMAHFRAADNLKRLLMLLAPQMLSGFGFSRLEQAWARYAERAADDDAVAGDARRATLLAEVLVKVARGRYDNTPSLASPLVGSRVDLQTRVERLLLTQGEPTPADRMPASITLLVAGPIALAAWLVAMGASKPVFELLEHLLHL